jgi:hypothetical protein
MLRKTRWVAAATLATLLGCTGAWAAPAVEAPARADTIRDDTRADYVRGYGDGLKGKLRIERDDDYRAGHRAGRAMREANEKRPDAKSYHKGYIDGYDHYLDRRAPPGSDGAYLAGYRAGQADHTALVTGTGRPAHFGSNADYQAGFRDGKENRTRRFDERANPSYAKGWSEGQKVREPTWLDKGLPTMSDR